MNKLKNDEQIHCIEIEEIVAAPPIWLYKWGVTVSVTILLICISFSALISVPRLITAQMEVYRQTVHSIILPRHSRVIKIVVKDKDFVQKNQPLAVVETGSKISILRTENGGFLTFAGSVQNNQLIDSGLVIFRILETPGQNFGKIVLSNWRKKGIRVGMCVILKNNTRSDELKPPSGVISQIMQDSSRKDAKIILVKIESTNQDNSKPVLKSDTIIPVEIVIGKITLLQQFINGVFKSPKG